MGIQNWLAIWGIGVSIYPVALASGELFWLPLERSLGSKTPAFEGIEPKNPQRGCWIWHAVQWRENSNKVLTLLVDAHCHRVYITIPHRRDLRLRSELDTDVQSDLVSFLERSNSKGISVWATEGDPHFAIPSHQFELKSHISALQVFNSSRAKNASRIDGVQFDIEPWSLPQWTLSRSSLVEGWINAVHLSTPTDTFGVDVVIPYWIQPDQKEYSEFFKNILKYSSVITVMNYQTNLADFDNTTRLFLMWGNSNRQKVRFALERGKILEPLVEEDKVSFIKMARDPFFLLVSGLEKSMSNVSSFAGLSVHGLDQ